MTISEGSSVFRSETVVDHAEFADRFLRRRSALRAVGSQDVVGAIDGDGVVQIALAAEGNADNVGVRKRGLRAGVAHGNVGAEKGKIGKQPATNREGVDLLRVDDLTDFRAGRLDDGCFCGDDDLFPGLRHLEGDINRGDLRDT